MCVDLLPGPGNGFCTTHCADDSQCPEGYDCIVTGDDELSYSACVEVDFYLDEDEDGFGVGPGCISTDCDDVEPAINPAVDEVCNDVDDDCDDVVDDNTAEEGDDCETGYPGVCGEGRVACVAGLTECVPRVASSAESTSYDDDCDDDVNEGSAVDAIWWFTDEDGDGQGLETPIRIPPIAIRACTRPCPLIPCLIGGVRYIDNDLDCDDTSARL